MSGTLIAPVRKALIDALKADPAWPSTQYDISYQLRATARPNRDATIWTREPSFSQESAALRAGRNFRDEVGRFALVVLVARSKSIEDTSEAASEICDQLGAWVSDRKNNDLGVQGLETLVIDGEGTYVELWTDEGTLVEIGLPIRYTARLT